MKIILYLWEIRRTEWERITLKEANVKKTPYIINIIRLSYTTRNLVWANGVMSLDKILM